jgi:arylsulfatase A-like enzyme
MTACFVRGMTLVAALLIMFSAAADERPNVVFILADDLGYTDLACYGSGYYETPHLDRMAAAGMRFTNAYTCGANCQPTRAALLSGQYGPRTGVYTVGSIDRFNWQSRPLRPVDNVTKLPLDRVTVAQCLQDAGYSTGMFGKWHLGDDAAHHPSQRGFEEAVSTQGRHFDFETDPPVEHERDAYLADFLTDKAEDFIRRHRDRPFFLYLPHFGVHTPWEAKEKWIDHFAPKAAAGGHDDPTYAAMIASVDESVGRIRALLDELGLERKTLLIFTSDNGGVGGYTREGIDSAKHVTDNAPLRGGKGMYYDGGIRVPFIACWPGRIAAHAVCEEPIISVDLYPTLLDVTTAPPPAGQPLDGTSCLPLLTDTDQAPTARPPLYWHFPGFLGERSTSVGAIRDGDWKLMEFFEDGQLELYDLTHDVGEAKNLAEDEPARAAAMQARLAAWRHAIHAPMPTPNTKP